MPENYVDLIEQLRLDNDHLLRVIGGDARSHQAGLLERLDGIQSTLVVLTEQMRRVWIAISLSFGLLLMVIVQLLWHGMHS
jgi:hypothetical protein